MAPEPLETFELSINATTTHSDLVTLLQRVSDAVASREGPYTSGEGKESTGRHWNWSLNRRAWMPATTIVPSEVEAVCYQCCYTDGLTDTNTSPAACNVKCRRTNEMIWALCSCEHFEPRIKDT